jgi:hypothetical protein
MPEHAPEMITGWRAYLINALSKRGQYARRSRCPQSANIRRPHDLLLRQALERGIQTNPVVRARRITREPRARQPPLDVLSRLLPF